MQRCIYKCLPRCLMFRAQSVHNTHTLFIFAFAQSYRDQAPKVCPSTPARLNACILQDGASSASLRIALNCSDSDSDSGCDDSKARAAVIHETKPKPASPAARSPY
jgi:hypothetical protein